MGTDFSMIQYEVNNFHNVLLSSRPFFPITTLLIKLVLALIEVADETPEEIKTRVDWIYKNTHENVNQNISIIELAVFRNLDKGLNREIEIGTKSYNLTQLYKYLDEVTKELTQIVVKISKKYNLEIPIGSYGKGGGIVNPLA